VLGCRLCNYFFLFRDTWFEPRDLLRKAAELLKEETNDLLPGKKTSIALLKSLERLQP